MITINRYSCTANGTFGKLYIDNNFICYTLEPPKVSFVHTKPYCIPDGTYPLLLTYSNRFSNKSPYIGFKSGRVPLIDKVDGFDGIRIHCGNYPLIDTQGCILVSSDVKDNVGIASQKAYQLLMNNIDNQSLIQIKTL